MYFYDAAPYSLVEMASWVIFYRIQGARSEFPPDYTASQVRFTDTAVKTGNPAQLYNLSPK
jgi:hypothetical protein